MMIAHPNFSGSSHASLIGGWLPLWKIFSRVLEGAVKIDVEHAGRARMICVVLKLNIDFYQYNETQLLTEAICDERGLTPLTWRRNSRTLAKMTELTRSSAKDTLKEIGKRFFAS